jgi:hypothetical protein
MTPGGADLIPDVEAIVGAYLRQHPAMKTLSARVVGETPSDKSRPWVRVTQLDDPAFEDHHADYLIDWMGQFDCYPGPTGGQEEASLVSRTVRRALKELPDASVEGLVVSRVQFLSCPRLLDTDLEPARWRYARSATLRLHPR